MSELDRGLKLAARRLAWSQGLATRLNVPLRAYVERRPGRSGFEEYTDLDVLTVGVSPSGRVEFHIYDCKSSSSRTTERAFWLRGVADFFDADDAWMLRPTTVTDAARQLADKLKLGVLTEDDLQVLSRMYAAGSMHRGIGRLFTSEALEKSRAAFTGLDKRLSPLRDYMNYDFWVYRPYRNLSQMVAHLTSVAGVLESKSPVHTALLFDCAWLYTLSLAQAAEYVRRTKASAVYSTLHEFFLGGQLAIREKEVTMRALKSISPEAELSVTPEYFDPLVETFARLYVRPKAFVEVMRYCEVATAGLIDGRRPSLTSVLGRQHDPIYGKLLFDVVAFLVSSAKLAPSFRATVKAIALDPPPVANVGSVEKNDEDSGQSGGNPTGVEGQQEIPMDVPQVSRTES